MRDFYEPVYGSYQSNQTPPAFQQVDHFSKKTSSTSSSNVFGRFLKLGKSKSDANGSSVKSRARPSSYHDDFEGLEDFRLTTTSSKSPVERMVHKVNSRKDVSRSHSWIYGSVKLPSDLPFGYGYNSHPSPGGGSASSQQHNNNSQPDFCGACDCTADFDFLTPHQAHHQHGGSVGPPSQCQACYPHYPPHFCGKKNCSNNNKQHGYTEKKFASSVRKLTWKSLKQVVKKRPTLDALKKPVNANGSCSSPPSKALSPCNMIPPTSSANSHDDLLNANYFFPEKKTSFYASCTDLYGDANPHVTASVRVRPKRSRQPWPFPNEFGPVPNYQEEEIYHSEWDLRQFMPYDVWLAASNSNPMLNNQTKIPKVNSGNRNALMMDPANAYHTPENYPNHPGPNGGPYNQEYFNNAGNGFHPGAPGSPYNPNTSPCVHVHHQPQQHSANNNSNKKSSTMDQKIYGQAIVKRSSILQTDVTAYQLIKSTTTKKSSANSSKEPSSGGPTNDDSDELSDNVISEDPVRIGGQGIYMVPSQTPNYLAHSSSSASSSSFISSSNSNSSTNNSLFAPPPAPAGNKSNKSKESNGRKIIVEERKSKAPQPPPISQRGDSSRNESTDSNANSTGLKTYLSQPVAGDHVASSNNNNGISNTNCVTFQAKIFSPTNRVSENVKNNENANEDISVEFQTFEMGSHEEGESSCRGTQVQVGQCTVNTSSGSTLSAAEGVGSSSNNNTSNNGKYGALKRRKRSSSKQTLVKETIYEEESENSDEWSKQQVYAVKIVVSQNVASEYVKPILKKEKVYDAPELPHSNRSLPDPGGYSHNHHQKGNNGMSNGGGDYSNGSGPPRTTKKVQFDQTKVVVCGGLSEDEGTESDDTLVKEERESEWIVDDDGSQAEEVSRTPNQSASSSAHRSHPIEAQVIEKKSEKQLKSSRVGIHHFNGGHQDGQEEREGRECELNNVIDLQPATRNSLSHNHQQAPLEEERKKAEVGAQQERHMMKGGGDSMTVHPPPPPPPPPHQKAGKSKDVEKSRVVLLPPRNESSMSSSSSSNASPTKAQRIANAVERKTAEVPVTTTINGHQKVINPNSLLFHDTTRIRLNQSRPSLEQTFKLNMVRDGGSPGRNSTLENGGSFSGQMARRSALSRVKQSNSFRHGVLGTSGPLRPKEPPPPPPVSNGRGSSQMADAPGGAPKLQKTLFSIARMPAKQPQNSSSYNGAGNVKTNGKQGQVGIGGSRAESKPMESLKVSSVPVSSAIGKRIFRNQSENQGSVRPTVAEPKNRSNSSASTNSSGRSSVKSKSLADKCKAVEAVSQQQQQQTSPSIRDRVNRSSTKVAGNNNEGETKKRLSGNNTSGGQRFHSSANFYTSSANNILQKGSHSYDQQFQPTSPVESNAQNIEIVTKENSVSEIRIYSGSQHLNINPEGESAQVLRDYGEPNHKRGASQSDNKIEEIHYAATDILCPSEQAQQSNYSGDSTNNGRPQSTSVVLIIAPPSNSSPAELQDQAPKSGGTPERLWSTERPSVEDQEANSGQDVHEIAQPEVVEEEIVEDTTVRSAADAEPLYDDVISSHLKRQAQAKKYSLSTSALSHYQQQQSNSHTSSLLSNLSKHFSSSNLGNGKGSVRSVESPPPQPPPLPPVLPPPNNSSPKNNNGSSNGYKGGTGKDKNVYNDVRDVNRNNTSNMSSNGVNLNLNNKKNNGTMNGRGPGNNNPMFPSMNYGRLKKEEEDGLIYDDTLSVISSNYGRSIIEGQLNDLLMDEEEPLYDDVLNLLTQDSDSGAETEDSPPPPLPAQGPPLHLLPKVSTELPVLHFPLLSSVNGGNNIPGPEKCTKFLERSQGEGSKSRSGKEVTNKDGKHGPSFGSSSSTRTEDSQVLDRTRSLLHELNEKLTKLNFSPDYSTYISKVVISSSSESSGVEEDYNSEKNYSLSNGSEAFDDNYKLTAVSKLVSETISMARGKFLDSMKSNSNPGGLAIAAGGAGGDQEEPIYEEIGDLNRSTSPIYADAFDAKSIFDGASRNEILTFLESIRDRLAAAESSLGDNSASSSLTRGSDGNRKSVDIERNDSGIGSESGSLVAMSKGGSTSASTPSHLHHLHLRLCSDCNDAPADSRLSLSSPSVGVTASGSSSSSSSPSLLTTVNGEEMMLTQGRGKVLLSLCRSCTRKRSERKEILLEIYETELKYGRDLKIIEDEFYNPIQIAGLLGKDQLDQIFLNVDQLIEINGQLTSMMKAAIDEAVNAGDEDLTRVNMGKIFMDFCETMMGAFESYCTRQANAGALLTQLEKEKELLRIFLRVSQMENTVLRRMNLPAFLMVPVQRVTRYPLLLARLLKVTPAEHSSRTELYAAQVKIEQHLEHMNKTTREVASVKLWRRISIINGSSSPVHRRSNSDLDGANVRIRKMALDVLDWANFNDVTCVIESQLNIVHFNGKALRNIYGCLLARGKDLEKIAMKMEQDVVFPPADDIVKDVKLVLVRVKNTRFCLLREPLCLAKCVISQGENEFQDFIEVNEIITKNTYYFQAMEKQGTVEWLRLLQCYAVCVGQWRKRRGALANIMMNGMIRHL